MEKRPLFDQHADIDVRTYTLDFLKEYHFVVIFARYQDQWVYTRHRQRQTWETAGGHIESGETVLEAARRELYEETGASSFEIRPLFDYSVRTSTEGSNGQVYLAFISTLGALPESEMAEITLSDTSPDAQTYPDILPVLFQRVQQMM